MVYRLTICDVDRLVDTIQNYGRRLAYEEFKHHYNVSEHNDEIFDMWEYFLLILEKDGRI